LALSTARVADRAGVSEQNVIDFECANNSSAQTMLAIHRVISGEADLAQLFTTPKFQTIADVIA